MNMRCMDGKEENAIEGKAEKNKVAHVHAMKRCRGSNGIAPLILNFDTSWR
jgi:hypothetical protein